MTSRASSGGVRARLPFGTWTVALQALAAHKLRAALSTLGVVIGSASIVLVVTIGLSGGRYVVAQIEGVGSNLAYAELVRTGDQSTTVSDEITLADLDAVRTSVPDVAVAAGSRDIAMSVVVDGLERPVTFIGVTDGFQDIRHLLVLRGRFLDADELAAAPKVCLLTNELARAMFGGADPVGGLARIGDLRLTVVGVFTESVSTFGASEVQPESVLVPFHLLETLTGHEFIRVLYAQARTADAVPEVTRALAETLRSRHRGDARYQVENLSGLLEAARNVSTALTVTLLAVALIALAVSGLGIMNVMLVTVTERTREIGLRKATGARRRTILAQFLIEAGLISGAGALIGVALAVGGLLLLRSFLPAGVTVPISALSIVAALATSSSVGLLFGYLPARRAATLQPVDALRYE